MRLSKAAIVLSALLGVTGCATVEGTGTADDATDSGGRITVWVDPPRVPAVNAFQRAFPDIPVVVNTINGNVGSTELQQKFVLFNQAGAGWPDAIFFPSNDDIAWAAWTKINYVRDISVDLKDVIDQYPSSVIAQCNIDGQYRCLRNDAAPGALRRTTVTSEASSAMDG